MAKIFLIEDNLPLRENTKILLTMYGYEVDAFESGLPALEQFKTTTPDLVLCDILLPSMSGYEILAHVRELKTGSQVPFIFLSALTERDQVREGMNLGADDYITKPFTSEGLLATIKCRLDRVEKARLAIELENQRFHELEIFSLPHEIRTPLNGIIGGIDIFRGDPDLLGSGGSAILDLIEDSAARLEKTLLNYILYLTLSAGRDPFGEKTLIEVGAMVTSAATKQAADMGRENDLILHTFEWHMRCGGCLDRVVAEVVSNAFKFSKPGSKVEVRMIANEGQLTLTCRDHGCGMTEQEILEIAPFRQFHKKERAQQGLGLGLSICQAGIKCDGCSLGFRPEEPSGLSVEVTVPNYKRDEPNLA